MTPVLPFDLDPLLPKKPLQGLGDYRRSATIKGKAKIILLRAEEDFEMVEDPLFDLYGLLYHR
ncbi:MAG: hypothetical protein QXS76_00270 [Candidatus Bathyarchaeia archaeon]